LALTTDILIVSVDSTGGWRAAARELAQSCSRAGARVETVSTEAVPKVRTFALTDLVQAMAARRACLRGIARYDPTAIVYCSITAALAWPRPGAVWLDSIAAENRPGRHGIWQRVVERRRLASSPLVLAMSARSLEPLERARGFGGQFIVLPTPVERSEPEPTPNAPRDIAALTYAGDPEKKRLGVVLAAWEQARRGNETLVVAGIDGVVREGGIEVAGRRAPEGVEVAGRLDPAAYRALLRRARVFVAAPAREDYGIAPLEALADGCVLVTTPSPGPYPALDLARALDPRLVGEDLVAALRTALADPLPDYARRASELLAPFGRAAVDATVSEHVLPRLLPGYGPA